jgi:transcription elongation factor SPT5
VYEGKFARIIAVQKAGHSFDQTAMVKFESGETRSILAKYIVPVQQFTKDAEALALTGKHKGQPVKIWEVPDRNVVTYSTLDMTAWEEVPGDQLALLWPENQP